jgi:hypothetical protein
VELDAVRPEVSVGDLVMDFHNVYFGCAAIGGCILVLQTLMALVGGGSHDGDVPHDVHDLAHAHSGDGQEGSHGDAFVRFFTFKTIVAFLTFFGLAGLAGDWAKMQRGATFLTAAAAGIVALVIVAWLMHVLSKLQSKGNLRLENAIGRSAQVYLVIPANGVGAGKVTVAMQGRTIELRAVTSGAEIPTGATVKVVALRATDTLEVLPMAEAAV